MFHKIDVLIYVKHHVSNGSKFDLVLYQLAWLATSLIHGEGVTNKIQEHWSPMIPWYLISFGNSKVRYELGLYLW